MRKKRNLYQSKHPFDEYPFEAFFSGSWKIVERIAIADGTMTMRLVDNRYQIVGKRPFSNLRVRSRQATLTDCTCFLRPGIDICVLSNTKRTEGSDNEIPEPMWLDAKISSIERKPHETDCSCQYYVKFYAGNDPFGLEKKKLSKETEVVRLEQIFILQRLEKHPIEGQHYRWDFADDCTTLPRTKLLLGKFSADISWLVVCSVMHQIAFEVRSLQNRIVYQVIGNDDEGNSSNSYHHVAINFKVDGEITTSNLFKFTIGDIIDPSGGPPHLCGEGQSPFSDVMDLRRSKRRNTQPERFLGFNVHPEMNTSWTRIGWYKVDRRKEEDEEDSSNDDIDADDDGDDDDDEDWNLPLAQLLKKKGKASRKHQTAGEERFIHQGKKNCGESGGNPSETKRKREESKTKVNQRKNDKGASKLGQHRVDLSSLPLPTDDPIPLDQFDFRANASAGPIPLDQFDFPANASKSYLQEINAYRSKFNPKKRGRPPSKNKVPLFDDFGFESRPKRKPAARRPQGRRGRPPLSKAKGNEYFQDLHVTYRKTTLSAGAYSKLISAYMKDIDLTVEKEDPNIMDQWNDFKAGKVSDQNNDMEEDKSSDEDEGEMSETEMLWKEMEMAMVSAYFLDGDQDSNAAKNVPKSDQECEHDYVLKEEIGMLCRLCGVVGTEIKYVSAPFAKPRVYTSENKATAKEDDTDNKVDEGENFGLGGNEAPSEVPPSEEHKNPPPEQADNVWALIPTLGPKLHVHQKKAFEFLWRNVAGALDPSLMAEAAKNTGGCCISHSPGAGKTLLMIAFLSSYLKLFPGKRPLVLAPKTTLYTWYKEFLKWKMPLPVHLIHGRRTYRVFKNNTVKFKGVPTPSQDVMHVIDCLEKIQKWHAQPSVLVMGYTSFLTLMREDSKFAHRRYMAKVLRESPGILVLDEGHNPRSTKSRLRKALMKVETELRIMLSGTLFQNNFCEYFNTLCLSRPKFIHEVLLELDPKSKKKKKVEEKARHLLESRARKLFLDTIARKIDSGENEERIQGLNMLKNLTSGFIDVYETGSSDALPGLQIYTLFMNPSDIQNDVLMKLQTIMATYHGYPLELELLITLASIHPSLIRTSNCVSKFFDRDELEELDNHKFDFRKGSKVMFVLNLVHRVTENEKVLIFCHNIAPIILFIELFENVFNWRKGAEILVLTGDQELFERGRVIDKFEEPGGASKILFASITACAEGISLTAASRVILLDSEWNPSKTKQAIARAFRPGQQKVVYVYQLLARGTLEEGKYNRTTWKEWVSSMIFSEDFVEDPSCWQAQKIEDNILREMVAEDKLKSFHMIMKNEKASTG